MKKILGAGILFALTATIGGVLLISALSPSQAHASSALPPRPTPRPTPDTRPAPSRAPSIGGLITLDVEANIDVIRKLGHWQSMWTVVQWQDGVGNWHDVEGWQGTLDTFGGGMGRKTWWVAEGDLGAGPFRWMVYHGRGGELLAYSEPFYLPSRRGRIVVSDVSLAP